MTMLDPGDFAYADEQEHVGRYGPDPDPAEHVQVLDDSRRNSLPTGYVTVTVPEGATDHDLADAAGFAPRHFGWHVTRHDDSTATVALWND